MTSQGDTVKKHDLSLSYGPDCLERGFGNDFCSCSKRDHLADELQLQLRVYPSKNSTRRLTLDTSII